MNVIFKKYIWEIRTGNPSLAVKSLMIPLDQSFHVEREVKRYGQKVLLQEIWWIYNRDRERERERENDKEIKIFFVNRSFERNNLSIDV